MTTELIELEIENFWKENREFHQLCGIPYRFQNSNGPNTGSDKKKRIFDRFSIFHERVGAERRDILISILVTYQEKYDSPSKEDLNKVKPFNPCGSTNLIPLITEKTFLSIQLIVEFAQKIPGFSILCVEDQEVLLKMYHSEVILLKTARKYCMEPGSLFFANNGPFTRNSFHSACASMREFGQILFNFCQTMWCLKVDKAEYALLTAIVIFSSSPCLLQPKQVEEIQAFYTGVLRAYIDINRPGSNHFSYLLNMLPELRDLSNMFRNLYLSLEVDIKKLPPFLEEFLCEKRKNYFKL